jgi:hypothetical protein
VVPSWAYSCPRNPPAAALAARIAAELLELRGQRPRN